MHFSRTARDLGLSSLGLQQYATGVMPSLQSMFPSAKPFDVYGSGLMGLTPTQLVSLRSNERAQKMQLMAQQATMPGKTAIWGNYLTQMGGSMLGAGMMGGMGGGGTDSTGGAMWNQNGMTMQGWNAGMGSPYMTTGQGMYNPVYQSGQFNPYGGY